MLNDTAGDSRTFSGPDAAFVLDIKQAEAARAGRPPVWRAGDCQQYRVQFLCGKARSGQRTGGGWIRRDGEGGALGRKNCVRNEQSKAAVRQLTV
ncbi:hypothetical protein KCP69_21930 [Salmonella enterica subsp. enterica]|nr:hypothetical protein KCP69_21930 [Salmonella enterica subsp. enterica]